MSTAPSAPSPPPRSKGSVRILRQGEEPGDDLSASTTPEERIELVWELSRRMWDLTGRPVPRPTRDQLPVRLIRPA